MTQQRACDICGFFRQARDGTSTVHRYGLSRQIPVPGRTRVGRPSVAFKRERGFGGLDICDQCWEAKAKPKTRPRS